MLLTRALPNLVLLPSIFVISFGLSQVPKSRTDICELARNPQKYEGKLVTIRGIVELESPSEGELHLQEMTSDSCRNASSKKIRVGIEYPDSHFLDKPPVGYKVDEDSFQRTSAMLKEAIAQGRAVKRLRATIRGVVQAGAATAKPVEDGQRPHHRQYPVYIVIESIDDAVLRTPEQH